MRPRSPRATDAAVSDDRRCVGTHRSTAPQKARSARMRIASAPPGRRIQRTSSDSRLTYVRAGNVARHSVILPAWRGSVTLTKSLPGKGLHQNRMHRPHTPTTDERDIACHWVPLDAVAEYGLAACIAQKATSAPHPDPIQDLRHGWDLHVAFDLAHPALYAIMSGGSAARPRSPAVAVGREILRRRIRRRFVRRWTKPLCSLSASGSCWQNCSIGLRPANSGRMRRRVAANSVSTRDVVCASRFNAHCRVAPASPSRRANGKPT